ncbi:hypothetical protein ACIQKB_30740 [Streptomyces sp. NPDC092046]|uniref:hypothetical protein n=1 Tax=Streptomyces sp. NPDC092046 TaxID=3366009 RepID=UPI0038309FA1
MAGREHELAVLRGSIRDGAGLLTLTGPPGPLKSRLLREALRREGVEALWEPADLLTPENLPALARLLRRRLAAPGAPRVLVLDGWERLGPRGAALVAGLLREAPAFAPGLTVLVTALRALRLKEEQVLAVAQGPAHHGEDGRERGRECGRDDTREDAREAPREDGREAPREDPREDGPSALQLGAAESGYARCDPLERLLWERISVFEGSFGREAVREVCASGALPAGVALDVLDRLAPLALLPVDDGDPGEERYWMPPPMRAVGARRLTERGDRWAAVLRHRRWYVKVARRATDWWQGGRQLDARALALLELPDLAAAMDPTTAPLSPAAETDTAVEIAVSLWFLWVACGRVAEGRSRLRHALALARVRTDPEAAQEALDRADVHSWAGRDVWADAWAQYARAELHYWDGEPGRAAERATRALREHLRIGCVSGAACAAELLAQMRILRGRPTTAAHLLGAADLLRSSAYEDGYRPARFCSPSRERSESALREHLSAGELRRAYEEGARRGLHALVAEP